MKLLHPIQNERGIVLVTGLLFLAVLMTLGTTSVMITSNDVTISRNYNNAAQAFNNAESGVQYGIGLIEDGLSDASFSMPSNVGDTATITDPATDTVPGAYNFSISVLTRSADNRYDFTSTGDGSPNPPASTAQATLEVTIKRDPAISYAAFGDDMADLNSLSNVYSYDSRGTVNPTPADSTGEADVGSNGEVSLKNATFVDGNVALGDDGSTEAVLTQTGSPVVTGTSGVDVPRVDPDPLGVVGGEYANKFTTYSSSNDNNLATGDGTPIAGNTISLGNTEIMTLNGKAGGANYYLSSITLNNGATLIADTTAGPVNVFLTGPLEAKNGSAINMTAGSVPTDFAIFSNSTSSLIFKHGGDFKGLCYAPYATVEMKNSADVYGAIWAQTVDMKSSAVLYYDTALKDKYFSKQVSIASWENVR